MSGLLSNLQDVLNDPIQRLLFAGFLDTQLCSENLLFCDHVEAYSRIKAHSLREETRKMIISTFIKEGSASQINIDHQCRVKCLDPDAPSKGLFDEAVNYVMFLLQTDIMHKFKLNRKLVADLKENKLSYPCKEAGQMRVDIESGMDLAPKDINGFSDPYCALFIAMGKTKSHPFRTTVKLKTLNPVWNETTIIDVTDHQKQEGELVIQVWDKDSFSADDYIGECKLSLKDLNHDTSSFYELDVHDMRKNKNEAVTGKLKFHVDYLCKKRHAEMETKQNLIDTRGTHTTRVPEGAITMLADEEGELRPAKIIDMEESRREVKVEVSMGEGGTVVQTAGLGGMFIVRQVDVAALGVGDFILINEGTKRIVRCPKIGPRLFTPPVMARIHSFSMPYISAHPVKPFTLVPYHQAKMIAIQVAPTTSLQATNSSSSSSYSSVIPVCHKIIAPGKRQMISGSKRLFGSVLLTSTTTLHTPLPKIATDSLDTLPGDNDDACLEDEEKNEDEDEDKEDEGGGGDTEPVGTSSSSPNTRTSSE